MITLLSQKLKKYLPFLKSSIIKETLLEGKRRLQPIMGTRPITDSTLLLISLEEIMMLTQIGRLFTRRFISMGNMII